MNQRFLRGIVSSVCLALTVSGCAHGPPAPVEDRTQRAAIEPFPVIPFPPPEDVVADRDSPNEVTRPALAPDEAVAPGLPATEQLLAAADEAIAAGQYGAAGANVERAIRIAPADPWAWHRLAKLRFAEGEYDQAKATAFRSNALPGATSRLRAANWFLIADIERFNGDVAAANEAYDQAQKQLSAGGTKAEGRHDSGGNLPLSE